jgi:hypothetical protein
MAFNEMSAAAQNSPVKENIPPIIVPSNDNTCDARSQSTTHANLLAQNKSLRLQDALGLTNNRTKFLSIKVGTNIFAQYISNLNII